MAAKAKHGFKLLEITGKWWNRQEIAENSWTWLEMAENA